MNFLRQATGSEPRFKYNWSSIRTFKSKYDDDDNAFNDINTI